MNIHRAARLALCAACLPVYWLAVTVTAWLTRVDPDLDDMLRQAETWDEHEATSVHPLKLAMASGWRSTAMHN